METTHSGFWTIRGVRPGERPITFCEPHALSATNEGFALYGIPAAETMSEAANVTAMVAALAGNGDKEDLFTYSDIGVCAQCEAEARRAESA